MADEAKATSWWQTVPGILTAVAAVVTALTGLIAALVQGGLIGAKGVAASHTPATASAPAQAARTAQAAQPVETPDGSSVAMVSTGTHYRYTIASAQREPVSPGRALLKLRVQAWTDAEGGVAFWSDSFRLRVGEMRLKPVNFFSELVARDETRAQDVEFEVDAAVKEAVLAIAVSGVNFDGNTRELRLLLR
jgi:hypothetical protein